MTDFSRRARWLNALFPASTAPQIQDPGSRSDDVSLVQPYDGGGYGFPGSLRPMVSNHLSTVGVTGFNLLVETTPEQIFYIGAVAVFSIVQDYNDLILNIIEQTTPPRQAIISDNLDLFNAANIFERFNTSVKVMGPNSHLRIDWTSAGTSAQFNATLYGVLAPLGTVFQV